MKKLILILLFLPSLSYGTTTSTNSYIRESLIGINETHIYVLREIHNDVGKDDLKIVDIVLIERQRNTNIDEQLWPVSRIFDLDTYMNWLEEIPPHRVEVSEIKEAVNPFDILSERKARPGLWQAVPADELSGVKVLLEDQAVTISADMNPFRGPATSFRLSFEDVANAIEASIAASEDVIEPYFEGAGSTYYSGLNHFEMRDMSIDPIDGCTFEKFLTFYEYADRQQYETFLVLASCQGDREDAVYYDGIEQADVILEIPAQKQ